MNKMSNGNADVRNEIINTIRKIVDFKIEEISREKDFGPKVNFSNAIEPAKRLVEFYKRVPADVIELMPESRLDDTLALVKSSWNTFNNVMNTQPGIGQQTIQTLVNNFDVEYRSSFERLGQYIHFSDFKKAEDLSTRLLDDFRNILGHHVLEMEKIERELQQRIQTLHDKYDAESQKTLISLNNKHNEAVELLALVRKTAEEKGVSQQAGYYKVEADKHDNRASMWLWVTAVLTVIVISFAVVLLFIPNFSSIKLDTVFEQVQFTTSKLLIIAALSYFLILSAKNYLAHKHNAVVNRHRQNALMTFQVVYLSWV
jgi:cation transport ATPase